MNTKRIFPLSLLLLTFAIFAGVTPATAQITYFTDSLQGPSSPNLSIDFTKYSYVTGSGLARTSSSTGNVGVFVSPSDRPMNRTLSGNTVLNCNFIYDLTVRTGADNFNDLTFIGFGQGVASNPDNEPSNAFLFRIHNNAVGNRIDAVVAKITTGGFESFLPGSAIGIGTYDPAGTTFRVMCAGSGPSASVTLSVLGQPASARTFTLGTYSSALGLTTANTNLFFGNSATGTTFSNFSLKPALPTNKDQCKDDGWRAFGVFKNQGDCVSFVATGGTNPPGI